jgi:hypothetical protein
MNVRVTQQNGFHPLTPNNLTVTVYQGTKDPVAREKFQVTALAPQVILNPEQDTALDEGHPGRIEITAPAATGWTVSGVPPWMSITSGLNGSGDGTVLYRIARNPEYRARSATLQIGDATFLITQQPALDIKIPYTDLFDAPPAREAAGGTLWILQSQDKGMKMSVSSDGPANARSLAIDQMTRQEQLFDTQIFLPRIQTQRFGSYVATVSLKSQTPGMVAMVFEQRIDPWEACSPQENFPVETEWRTFTYHFKGGNPGCEIDKNRLSIRLGAMSGKMWISQFSITPDPAESHP